MIQMTEKQKITNSNIEIDGERVLVLNNLRRRLNAARQRAAYWSGRPSARNYGFSPCVNSTRDHCIEYEKALDDCQSLSEEIGRITGKSPIVTDYKGAFRDCFSFAMSEASKKST